MSLSIIREVFEKMTTAQACSICLVRVKTRKRDGQTRVEYSTRGIELKPDGALLSLIDSISKLYLGDGTKKGKLDDFSTVREYDGTSEATTIYKLLHSNDLIADEYAALINALATPKQSGDPFEFSASAYVLNTQVEIDAENMPVKFFSIQNPVCTLKHKFLYGEGVFCEMPRKVLNLRPTVDVCIVGETVYLFTMAGENLFNMEHSYKTLCYSIVGEIGQTELLSDFAAFKEVATSGHNPRRFVSYSKDRFEQMRDTRTRELMAKTFKISLTADGKIDTSSKESANNLVRVLCKRGMLDPFEGVPVEVSSAMQW